MKNPSCANVARLRAYWRGVALDGARETGTVGEGGTIYILDNIVPADTKGVSFGSFHEKNCKDRRACALYFCGCGCHGG